MAFQSWVTDTLELKESVLRSQSADVEVACGQLLGRKSFQFECRSGATTVRSTKFIQQSKNILVEDSNETISRNRQCKDKVLKDMVTKGHMKSSLEGRPSTFQILRLLLMAKFDFCMRCSGR